MSPATVVIATLIGPVVFLADSVIGAEIRELSNVRLSLLQWYQAPSVDIARIEEDPVLLLEVVGEKQPPSKLAWSVNEVHRTAAHLAVIRMIKMIGAKDFASYNQALRMGFDGEVSISSWGYRKMRYDLTASRAVLEVSELSDGALCEAYWVLKTELGAGADYFVAIVRDESFFQIGEITSLPGAIFPDPFSEDTKKTGRLAQASSFLFNGTDATVAFDENGRLLILDIRLVMKTAEPGVAYPIVTRCWWDEQIKQWVPWYAVEYNALFRGTDIAF